MLLSCSNNCHHKDLLFFWSQMLVEHPELTNILRTTEEGEKAEKEGVSSEVRG